MPTKSEAVAATLQAWTHPDLANLYSLAMECQVNVAQDNGERISSEYKSKSWVGWTDGIQTWKSFRIPYNASTDPEYDDTQITFSLTDHVEAIGMTGWDWQNKVSKWVAFDFDSLINHKTGLTQEELKEVTDAVKSIPWVTIRRSTSGKGIHLYVFLNDVPTENHTEHAALARAILGLLCAHARFDFSSKIDVCGGNMWVWHRKMRGTNGLTLIKEGEVFDDVPPNWKDHVPVVKGQRRRNLPQNISPAEQSDFELLVGQRPKIDLEESHTALIDFLKEINALWWWDQDNHMLVTHTGFLQRAHEELGLKGVFITNSPATNLDEQNCFAFPLRGGIWSVRRYTPGISEHESWTQDGAGWTQCFLNKTPDLGTAARTHGGLEDTKGGFQFREVSVAMEAARLLGTHINVGDRMHGRKATLKEHKDGRLIVEIERQAEDMPQDVQGFIAESKKWTRIYNVTKDQSPDNDTYYGNFDDFVRHVVTMSDEDYGWMIKTDGRWRAEPLVHVRAAMTSSGLSAKEVGAIVGDSVVRPWVVVNKPFQPEYPGDREWNRNSAQLRFTPLPADEEELNYPHWSKILNHCGEFLSDALADNGWAKANNIKTGADYLKCWIASLFQAPDQPLPYLFMYGPQNSGKSIFHEALKLLLTKGYQRAEAALVSQAAFNGELEGAIICAIEEIDLRNSISAYNRIKDWVTSRDLLIHCKGKTPYHIPNTSHWVQCANDPHYCPVFPGDTRITVLRVGDLDPLELVPKRELIEHLEKEAPAFLSEILRLELPKSNDRLNVPVITTSEKGRLEFDNMNPVETFIATHCLRVPGRMIPLGEFFERFRGTLEPDQVLLWTKQKVGKHVPPDIPKGRDRSNGQWNWGNLAWRDKEYDTPPLKPLVSIGDMLFEKQ